MGWAGRGGLWMMWPLLVLIGIVLLGYLAYLLVRHGRWGQPAGGASSARRILDERYARGEIDDQEYRQRRDELS